MYVDLFVLCTAIKPALLEHHLVCIAMLKYSCGNMRYPVSTSYLRISSYNFEQTSEFCLES